ncbi:MAG: hypothetical protein RL660_2344 [Bacteroidota bacterium]
MMKKLLLALALIGFCAADADAQFLVKKKKRKNVDTEQADDRPEGFEVEGFARDTDKRQVRKRDVRDQPKEGFVAKPAPEVSKAEKKAAEAAAKKNRLPRNRDIETLMADLTLAKIQKPVFRGIMTEHLRDIEAIMSREDIDNAEKNVLLKQVYVLRNKRLQETLNDEQYKIWMRIKDQDEYLEIAKPEDI